MKKLPSFTSAVLVLLSIVSLCTATYLESIVLVVLSIFILLLATFIVPLFSKTRRMTSIFAYCPKCKIDTIQKIKYPSGKPLVYTCEDCRIKPILQGKDGKIKKLIYKLAEKEGGMDILVLFIVATFGSIILITAAIIFLFLYG